MALRAADIVLNRHSADPRLSSYAAITDDEQRRLLTPPAPSRASCRPSELGYRILTPEFCRFSPDSHSRRPASGSSDTPSSRQTPKCSAHPGPQLLHKGSP